MNISLTERVERTKAMIEDRIYFRKLAQQKNFLDLIEEEKLNLYEVLHFYITPQSYGSKIENYKLKQYNLGKISSKKDKGDCVTKNGLFGEIKASFSSNKNEFRFVQIRPHQNCDFYLFIAINPEEDYKEYQFFIKNDEMKDVLKKMKATSCHGVNKKDNPEELSFTLKFNSANWKYFINNYLYTTEEIYSIVNPLS